MSRAAALKIVVGRLDVAAAGRCHSVYERALRSTQDFDAIQVEELRARVRSRARSTPCRSMGGARSGSGEPPLAPRSASRRSPGSCCRDPGRPAGVLDRRAPRRSIPAGETALIGRGTSSTSTSTASSSAAVTIAVSVQDHAQGQGDGDPFAGRHADVTTRPFEAAQLRGNLIVACRKALKRDAPAAPVSAVWACNHRSSPRPGGLPFRGGGPGGAPWARRPTRLARSARTPHRTHGRSGKVSVGIRPSALSPASNPDQSGPRGQRIEFVTLTGFSRAAQPS